jgi:DNA-binding XRE family transcriptional regulator
MGPSAPGSRRPDGPDGPGSSATARLPGPDPTRYRARNVARKKQPPISDEDRQLVGRLLREVRRAAGYRSVETAAGVDGCPAARQTIYAYERGGFTPSLAQFLELVEFYVLEAPVRGDGAKADEDLRAQGVAAVTQALTLRVYHVPDATDLIARMQPVGPARRRRRAT